MKIKLIITLVALIIFIFGLGYFVWGICYVVGGENLTFEKCPSNKRNLCYPEPPFVCYNASKPGIKTECGAACPDPRVFNQPWSKYERITNECLHIFCLYSNSRDYECGYVYRRVSDWYSIADKLQPNCNGISCGAERNGYLAAGKCDPKISGGFYKVCCNSDGTVGKSGPFFRQDNVNPPTEGICTTGRPKIVESGLNTSIPPGATSTHCTTTVPTTPRTTPPPPPPSFQSKSGGICNPVIEIYVRKGGRSDWQKQGVGKITYNSSSTEDQNYLLKKNDPLEFDVKLVNRGESISVKCGYQTCVRKCSEFVDCELEGTPSTTEACDDDPNYPLYTQNCTTSQTQCNEWGSTKLEFHSNNPDCEIRSNQPVSVKVLLDPNKVYKTYKTIDGSTSTLEKDPKISFEKIFTFLSSTFGFGGSVRHDKYPNDIAQIRPQRHGTYYVLATSSGYVYNVSNEKTVRGDDIDKQYVWCEVPVWRNGRWEIATSTGNGPFTLWQGEPTSSVEVSSAQVEFYVQPTEVKPILSIGIPNIEHPPGIKTAPKIYIAGYPFDVNYGVQVYGYWGEDEGGYWVEEEGFISILEQGGEQKQSTQVNPQHAGGYSIGVSHNADDEKLSQRNIRESEGYRPEIEENEAIGNLESQSGSVQVYRYLCYQGFCWECPKEPQREGIRLKVQEAGCKVVEDIKCQTYVPPNAHKSCKGEVKE